MDDVLRLQAAGAQVLDTREPTEFAAAHLAGSINIGLGGQYATWAGTVLTRERPIVVIAVPGRESEAAMRLGRIGFDNVAGYLQDGVQTLEARPELVRTTDRLSAELAAARLASSDGPVALDVRTQAERTAAEPAASRLLRWRLSLVHRRKPVAARGIHGRERDYRRHRGMGNRAATGHARALSSFRMNARFRPMSASTFFVGFDVSSCAH